MSTQWLNVGKVPIRPRQVGSEWWADLTCPAPYCGADATATSDTQFGEYEGVCGEGHEVRIPHAAKT